MQAKAAMTFTLCADGLPQQGYWKCDPAVADFNGDGFLDLAALPRLGKGPRVWLGDGTGKWRESSEGLTPGKTSCGGGIRAVDLNGDGALDLAVADHCQGVYTYLGDGTGKWTLATKELVPPPQVGTGDEFVGAENLDVGDVNNDGFPDLVVSSSDNGGIVVYLGDGSGRNWAWQGETALPTRDWAVRVKLGDINNDGFLDLAATFGDGPRVWLNDGHGSWIESSRGLPSPMMRGIFMGLDLGDANEDGRLDLLVGNWIDGPEIYLQQEDGSWRESDAVFPDMYGGAYGVAFGDLDRDGELDIVCSGRLANAVGYVYGLFVLKGDGRGNWEYVRNAKLPESGLETAWGVSIADINRDGFPDVVYGTGGIVATDPQQTSPVIATRLQVWCTKPAENEKAVLAASSE